MSLYAWKMFVPFVFTSSQQVIHTAVALETSMRRFACVCGSEKRERGGRERKSHIYIFIYFGLWLHTKQCVLHDSSRILKSSAKSFRTMYLCVVLPQHQPIHRHSHCEMIQQNYKIKKKYVCACFPSQFHVLLACRYAQSVLFTRSSAHCVSCASAIVRHSREISTESDKENVNEKKRDWRREGGTKCEIMSDKHKYIHIRFAVHIYWGLLFAIFRLSEITDFQWGHSHMLMWIRHRWQQCTSINSGGKSNNSSSSRTHRVP